MKSILRILSISFDVIISIFAVILLFFLLVSHYLFERARFKAGVKAIDRIVDVMLGPE